MVMLFTQASVPRLNLSSGRVVLSCLDWLFSGGVRVAMESDAQLFGWHRMRIITRPRPRVN